MVEAERLTGFKVTDLEQMKQAGLLLRETSGRAVLIKGGHLRDEATDVLVDGLGVRLFSEPRVATRNTHGTGCTLSSAIAALLACGYDLHTAVTRAKEYVVAALRTAPAIGHGAGPLNHRVWSGESGGRSADDR